MHAQGDQNQNRNQKKAETDMNILLIQPRSGFQLRGITFPVCRDLMMSATFLKKNGYDVLVWDRCISPDVPDRRFAADAAILFLAQSSSVKDAAAVSNRLRAKGVRVIWADMVAVIGADLPDALAHCDYILTGEYCFTARALLRAISDGTDAADVPGIAYTENGKTVFTQKRPLPDLAQLYPIDWSLIDVHKCFRRFQNCSRMLYLNASVGCPFDCGFCSTPFCYGKRRKRPISHVIQEINTLVREYGMDGINFSDELLLFTADELAQLKACRESLGRRFVWGGETRPQILTPELLRQMYDAGCRWLLFGLETGSETMRAHICKQYDPAQIRAVTDACTKLGIAVFGSFIIGFPNETKEDLRFTVRFAQSLDLDAYLFNYFVMIAHTPLYEQVKRDRGYRFRSIMEFDDVVNTDSLDTNFSAVPDKALATVKAYFDFLTITSKKRTAGQHTAGSQFVKKAINTAVEYLRCTPSTAFVGLYSIFRRGFGAVFYLLACPKIRREYGLYKKRP